MVSPDRASLTYLRPNELDDGGDRVVRQLANGAEATLVDCNLARDVRDMEFSPDGIVGQKIPQQGVHEETMPYIRMKTDLYGSPDSAGKKIASLVEQKKVEQKKPQFMVIRTILQSPRGTSRRWSGPGRPRVVRNFVSLIPIRSFCC